MSDANTASDAQLSFTGEPADPNFWRTLAQEIAKSQDRLEALLKVIGAPGTCKGCNAAILWVITKTGKRCPYNLDGISHYATCPEAGRFRKPARDKEG